jgi:hypothetical protein
LNTDKKKITLKIKKPVPKPSIAGNWKESETISMPTTARDMAEPCTQHSQHLKLTVYKTLTTKGQHPTLLHLLSTLWRRRRLLAFPMAAHWMTRSTRCSASTAVDQSSELPPPLIYASA